MNIFKWALGHRGVGNTVKRTAQILNRFGTGPGRMGGRFERFMDVLEEFGVRPTFPITALPMSRNPSFAHRLVERGAELAVHAWSHIDLTSLALAGQMVHMGDAIKLFREHGVPFVGFRAPYLHWNEDTMKVVESYQFRYSSNQTVFWDVIDETALDNVQRDGLEKGKAFYRPIPAGEFSVLPYRRNGFIEIPVSLPDDEIMLDRMYMKDADYLGARWLDILNASYRRGELFTVQLHPERIDFFSDALRGLLSAARGKRPGVWIATLEEITTWWVDKAANRITFTRAGDRHRADIRACKGATVYLRESGSERAVEPGALDVASDVRPCVGVSPESDPNAVRALADRGYVIEAGAPGDFAVHVGALRDPNRGTIDTALDVIHKCPGPLLRFGAWPHGNHSAMSVTGDIDALTIWDFLHRFHGA